MAQVTWLRKGELSGRPIVAAPGLRDPRPAALQVDSALARFPGAVPAWYLAGRRVRYWLIPVALAVGVAVCLAVVPAEPTWQVAWGLMFGLAAVPVGGSIGYAIAQLQTRAATGFRSPDRSLADAADKARPTDDDVVTQVTTLLREDPSLEAQVHELAWRTARPDAAARRRLEALWESADPAAAKARATDLAALQATVDAIKADRAQTDGARRDHLNGS